MMRAIANVVVGLGLAVSAMAVSAQVVVVGSSAAVVGKDEVVNTYLGRSFNLHPLDLPEGSAVRDAFYKKVTERDSAQVKAIWSRVVFSGKGQAPKVLPDDAAVKKALASDPNAIGYMDKSAVDGSVKVVMTLD
jgi:ABC-type phosphate transport system substrate-binding protein